LLGARAKLLDPYSKQSGCLGYICLGYKFHKLYLFIYFFICCNSYIVMGKCIMKARNYLFSVYNSLWVHDYLSVWCLWWWSFDSFLTPRNSHLLYSNWPVLMTVFGLMIIMQCLIDFDVYALFYLALYFVLFLANDRYNI